MMRSWIVIFTSVFLLQAQLYAEKTLAIFTYIVQGAKPWDPDSIHSGIAGSEESVIYISQQLAKLGYNVVVFGNPPKNSPHQSVNCNPRFLPLSAYDGTRYDIGISWRMPYAAPLLRKRANKVYFWPQDTPPSSQISDNHVACFDDALWISEWQRQEWIKVNPGYARFTKIFGNGINPDQFEEVKDRINPYSCIYASNYARGLEILLDIWPSVKKEYPQATLDIYYGWQHWNLLTPEKEVKMRQQIAEQETLGVTDHGLVGHEELNQAYSKTSFWTYPCIAPETFCVTGIRAQYAGAIPVIIQGSALAETVRYGFRCLKTEHYYPTLMKAMEYADQITLKDRKVMRDFIQKEYTWETLAKKWKNCFEQERVLSH